MEHLLFSEGSNVGSDRLMVIGLDGATFRVLDGLWERGQMPCLAGMMERGERAVLLSTVPPVTAPAWGTFLTGKDPGGHGVFDWRSPLRSAGGRKLLSGTDLHGQVLPGICACEAVPAVLVNIPMTYPPRETCGVLVTGMLTPSLESTFTWPPELSRDQLWRRLHYSIDVEPPSGRDDLPAFVDRLSRMTRARTSAVLALLERVPQWRLCCVVFVATDRLQHHLWHLMDEDHPLHRDRDFHVVAPFWSALDDCLSQLFERAGSLTPKMIVSDHGFGPLWEVVDVNAYLARAGLLCYRRGAAVRRFHLGLGIRARLGMGDATDSPPIDWAGTAAYSGSETEEGVYINVRDREPWGTVEEGADYERARTEVKAALEKLTDPDTGARLVINCFDREEIYSGPWVERAPDLLLELTPGYKVLNDLHRRATVLPVGKGVYGGTGRHQREGVLIVDGFGALSSAPHHIRDILPTILNVLRIPIPEGVEGRSLLVQT
jgi:predicted AlkP superfamily phosphohydrolase/phosphomutase